MAPGWLLREQRQKAAVEVASPEACPVSAGRPRPESPARDPLGARRETGAARRALTCWSRDSERAYSSTA
eukprot:3721265-Pyramimonas_sp.AAC.2